MDLTEAEDIKKRWQEYTEELYKKDPHDPDNHNGVITHLELMGGEAHGETVRDFLGSKITADGDCSHEIKRGLLPGRKVMTNLDRILKSRDITLPTKVCLVKTTVFPVVMYGCESWTIKEDER